MEERQKDFSKYVKNMYDIFFNQQETFEILLIANGTAGFLRNDLHNLHDINNNLKAFEFKRKVPQAVCLKAGLKESSGQIIVVLGSYQQITNDSLVHCLESMDDDTDIVNPWRQYRVDSTFRQLRSRMFNALVRKIIKTNLHDLNCTVKIFRREVLEEIQLYGNMYRYLPIVAAKKGFRRKEVICKHHEERGGKSGLSNIPEYFTRIIDILTLYFNVHFTRKPLRFFSGIGAAFFLISLLIILYIGIQKIILGFPIGNRPILLLALFLMIIGVQVTSVGLLGEIVAFTHGRQKKEYIVEKEI